MSIISISKEQARNFLIHYHGLDSYTFNGEKGVLEYIKRVGCIQYDPLNVVGRNPDLVLQSRIQGYSPAILEKLLYTERTLIDGWDKMMSIYRREDWPCFQRFRKLKEQELKRVLKWRKSLEAVDLTGMVRDMISQKGPIQSSRLNLGTAGNGRWGHKNLSSAAMDYMFNTGELGIYNKKNAQKVYDLIENLLPQDLLEQPDPFPNERDFLKWYFKRRVGSIGLLWARNGGGWLGYYLDDKVLRHSILSELTEDKSLLTISVEGINETFYFRKEDFHLLESAKMQERPEVRFLAPLDNLLWDRDMIDKIFGFKYSWEVYLPQEKRKYGYYVLPVLYGNSMIARFEPEQYRSNGPLVIKNWWWEDGVAVTQELLHAVEKGIETFCLYLQADGVQKSSLNKLKVAAK